MVGDAVPAGVAEGLDSGVVVGGGVAIAVVGTAVGVPAGPGPGVPVQPAEKARVMAIMSKESSSFGTMERTSVELLFRIILMFHFVI
jgi:hypothetical protein